MAGSVNYSVSVHSEHQCEADEELGKKWAARVRELAKEGNVKLPKKIRYFGCYGSWIVMSYTSNAMRSIVMTAAEELGMTLRHSRHGGKCTVAS